jgi:predicted nucleotidyltransferase
MEQIDILRHTVDVLERLEVPYLIVGSFASIAYGESRFTQDIDVVVALEETHVPGFVAAFPAPEFYLSESAIRDAIRTSFQFNVLHPSSGNKVDFILPRSDPWAALRMARGRPARLLPDRDVMVAAPEDVIIAKLWYYAEGGGDRHLRDIAGILRVTGAGVDRAEVERWARQLGYLEIWQQIVQKVDAPDPPTLPAVP